MGKKIKIRGSKKSRSGSGMNILDHISESIVTIFGLKIPKFFDADPDPGFGMRNLFDPGSGMEKFGSWINIPGPQHWGRLWFLDRYLI
jgi:hypothetical protein